MAIIVEKVMTTFDMKAQWAKEAEYPDSSEFLKRIARAKSWGVDMSYSLLTKPKRHDKSRPENEYYLYTMPGLLGTIFSLIELDTDRQSGIHKLEDIAQITNTITIPWVPTDTHIPREKRQKVMLVTPATTKNISQELSAMNLPHTRKPLNGENGLLSLDGHMEIFIKDRKHGDRNFMSLDYLAYNLHPFGDDVDDLTFNAVWNR